MSRFNYLKSTDLDLTKWKDRRCFILGGGPSLLNLDFSLIQNENTIGTNKAFSRYSVDINFFMDIKFYNNCILSTSKNNSWEKMNKAWKEFNGIQITVDPGANVKLDGVKVIRRKGVEGLSNSVEEGIYTASNSGYGALMLAVALGCNPIYLLGYDMQVEGNPFKSDSRSHWHEGYGHDRIQFQRKLDSFRNSFDIIASTLRENGKFVLNLNLNSNLKCFRFSTLDQVLRT